ncbi:MAG: TolC family protein [Bacteroidota bacterium]
MSKRILLCLLAYLFLINESFSQEPLSLADAIRIGLERNYDIQIEHKNVEIAANNNNWGEAGRYPTLSANLNQNNTFTNIDNPASFLAGDIQNNAINPTANLNWVLFDGFRARISKSRLENLQAQSSGNSAIVISNTIQAIILGYYLVILEEERFDAFEKQLRLSRDRYNYQKIRFDLGGLVTSDLLQEELNYLTDSINLINQELLVENSRSNLNTLLSEDPEKEFIFTDKMQPDLDDYTYDDLRTKMFSGNVDLKTQYLSQAVLRDDFLIARSERYPDLNFNAFYDYNSNRQDLGGASLAGGAPIEEPVTTAITRTIGANFTVSFTLFNGGRINRAIQNASINENIGNLRTENLKNSLSRDLAQALDRYRTRKLVFGISERQKEVAIQNLDVSNEKFKTGSINSFDYRTVQNANLTAEVQRLQSVYNLIDSKVELLRLTGGLIKQFEN